MDEASPRYRFHIHKEAPSWRLVLRQGTSAPRDAALSDGSFTREREAADVNGDVRTICDAEGYCLFKVGGGFEDVARDVLAARARRAP